MKTIGYDISKFAKEMEEVIKKHDEKKGDSWIVVPLLVLLNKLDEERGEVDKIKYELYKADGDESKIDMPLLMKELVDEANICMMLHTRLKLLEIAKKWQD